MKHPNVSFIRNLGIVDGNIKRKKISSTFKLGWIREWFDDEWQWKFIRNFFLSKPFIFYYLKNHLNKLDNGIDLTNLAYRYQTLLITIAVPLVHMGCEGDGVYGSMLSPSRPITPRLDAIIRVTGKWREHGTHVYIARSVLMCGCEVFAACNVSNTRENV